MSSESQSLLKGVAASGATVPAELKASYDRTKKSAFGSSQFMKIQMRDNSFVEILNTTGGLDRIQRELQDDEPAFFIWFRSNTLVAVLLWVPDDATAKNKTMYSTSKGAITDMVTAPGTKVEHLFGSKKSDFSLSSIQAAKDANDATLTFVERELQNLPRELPKSDLKKSQGYGLIAAVKGISMPEKLKNYSNSPSTSSYSSNTFPRSTTKSHVTKGDAQSRSIASAAAHAINTTSSPSEAAAVAATTPKNTTFSSPKASSTPKADVVSEKSTTFGSQEFEKCTSTGCNGRRAANSEYCVVHVDIYKAKNNTSESTQTAGKHCAVDGCEAARVTRGYCAAHANETHPAAQE